MIFWSFKYRSFVMKYISINQTKNSTKNEAKKVQQSTILITIVECLHIYTKERGNPIPFLVWVRLLFKHLIPLIVYSLRLLYSNRPSNVEQTTSTVNQTNLTQMGCGSVSTTIAGISTGGDPFLSPDGTCWCFSAAPRCVWNNFN